MPAAVLFLHSLIDLSSSISVISDSRDSDSSLDSLDPVTWGVDKTAGPKNVSMFGAVSTGVVGV